VAYPVPHKSPSGRYLFCAPAASNVVGGGDHGEHTRPCSFWLRPVSTFGLFRCATPAEVHSSHTLVVAAHPERLTAVVLADSALILAAKRTVLPRWRHCPKSFTRSCCECRMSGQGTVEGTSGFIYSFMLFSFVKQKLMALSVACDGWEWVVAFVGIRTEPGDFLKIGGFWHQAVSLDPGNAPSGRWRGRRTSSSRPALPRREGRIAPGGFEAAPGNEPPMAPKRFQAAPKGTLRPGSPGSDGTCFCPACAGATGNDHSRVMGILPGSLCLTVRSAADPGTSPPRPAQFGLIADGGDGSSSFPLR